MFGISRPEAFDWETERSVIEAQRLEDANPDLYEDHATVPKSTLSNCTALAPPSPPMSPSQVIAKQREERRRTTKSHINPLCGSDTQKCRHVSDDDVSEEEQLLLAQLKTLREENKKTKTKKRNEGATNDDPKQPLEKIQSIEHSPVVRMTSKKPFLAVTELMKRTN